MAGALPIIGGAMQLGAGADTLIRGPSSGAIQGAQGVENAYGNMQTPTQANLEFNLQTLQNMGALTPEMQQDINQQASGMNNISTDPALRSAQMQALANLQQRSTQGLTLEDRSALNQINSQVNQNNQANQGAVMQNMAMRGQLGSGNELAARLQAAQSSADTANQQTQQLATQAANNRIAATMGAGQLGSQIEGQQFGEAATKAQAQDVINQFNTRGQQQAQAANVNAQNTANQYNLDYQKQLNANQVATANQQGYMNINAYQTALNAQNQKLLGQAYAGQNVGTAQDKNFAGQMAALGQMGNTVSTLGMGSALGGASGASAAGGAANVSAPSGGGYFANNAGSSGNGGGYGFGYGNSNNGGLSNYPNLLGNNGSSSSNY